MGVLAGGKLFPMGLTVEEKPCDACKMEAALLFCCTDSTYMCMDCDSKIHGNNTHERVWLCEVCEHAPASVTCKADAAVLCVRCDLDIHSANPLARRHERVPVTPFYHSAVSVVKSTATAILEAPIKPESDPNLIGYQNCKKSLCNNNSAEMKSMELLFLDHDNLLEFDYPVPNEPVPFYGHHNPGADRVVPVQINTKPPPPQMQSADNHFEIDFTTFTNSSQNISSDVGVVPDGSWVSDISYPFITVNSSGKVSVATDREARVMRYREKRKNRKFEKTIRYASRKAYAETRPRIKGRFAKRSENTEDVDRWFTSAPATTNFMGISGFGVVPSF